MMHAGEGMSGGGAQWSLQHQCFWSTKAEGTGVFDRASPPRWYEPRLDLDVTYAKIAPSGRSRKWYTEYQAHFSKPSSTTPTVNACVPLIQGGRNER